MAEDASDIATRARRYVARRFDHPDGCTTGDLAEHLGVSPSHLCHVYREEFGMTIGEDIRRRRIDRACELLRDTDMLIKEVAAEAGYLQSTYRAFLDAFRAETDTTPSSYREQARAAQREPRDDEEARAS